mgnify:CR=1 FL=1
MVGDVCLCESGDAELLQEFVASLIDERAGDVQIADAGLGFGEVDGSEGALIGGGLEAVFLRTERGTVGVNGLRGSVALGEGGRGAGLGREVGPVDAECVRRGLSELNVEFTFCVEGDAGGRAVERVDAIELGVLGGGVYFLKELLGFGVDRGALIIGKRSVGRLDGEFAQTRDGVALKNSSGRSAV